MKKNSWLLVANSSLARVFKVQSPQSLIEIQVLEHPESRLHNLDLVSDKPGRGFESVGTQRHGLESGTTPKQDEFLIFARRLADYLKTAHQKGDYESLYIAAGPTLLGLLRQTLDPSVTKTINSELDKDMTHLRPEEMIPHLPFLAY